MADVEGAGHRMAFEDRFRVAVVLVVQDVVEESDDELAMIMRDGQTERIRYGAPDRVPEAVFDAVKDTGLYVARTPVLAEGRVELLWYVIEQSISHDYHRYGNLGLRADESRAEVL